MIPDDKVRHAHDALAHAVMAEQSQHNSTYTHPIDTTVPTSGTDRTTPRAQTREDFEEEPKDVKRRSRVSLSLAGMMILIVCIIHI
jgi:hypothetical protein